MKFSSRVELGGKTATGVAVPDDVVAALGSGKRPAVRITVGRHTYRTTVAPMGGRYFVPLSAENREAAGVVAGQDVEVAIEPDLEAREISAPSDLAEALKSNPSATATFDKLSYTHRKEWVLWIESSRQPETRRTRLEKTVAALAEGKRTR